MIRHLLILIIAFGIFSCRNYNKGVIAKKELRSKKSPSVKIAEEYDKKSKKYATKTYKNPKRAERARAKQARKHKKKGERYIKRQQRRIKREKGN